MHFESYFYVAAFVSSIVMVIGAFRRRRWNLLPLAIGVDLVLAPKIMHVFAPGISLAGAQTTLGWMGTVGSLFCVLAGISVVLEYASRNAGASQEDHVEFKRKACAGCRSQTWY